MAATPNQTGGSRRTTSRKSVRHSAILYQGGLPIPAVLSDISERGAKITLPEIRAGMDLDGPLRLELPGLGFIPLTLRWRDGVNLGVAFDMPEARIGPLKAQIARLVANHLL